jgi:predicted RNase H-like nuclease
MRCMNVVGVDGCRIGWISVRIDAAGDAHAEVFTDIRSAWSGWRRAGPVALALIDIPIGLRDSGPQPRLCEPEARRLLGPRRSSVFTPPLRSSLQFETYAAASANNHALSGRRLSKQAWGIAPKIREVDAFLADNVEARGRLRESHPEVMFAALNGGSPMRHAKRTRQGIEERMVLATHRLSAAPETFACVRADYPKREVAADDILDALILAIGATQCVRRGSKTLPVEPERDARGLPMEIVYR